MVLVGPSGCGKTTLLRSIGGLEKVTGGRILIGERDVTRLEPADRDLAMVFQNYALYPHMTVREEPRLRPPRPQDAEGGARRGASHEVAQMLGLEELLDRRPGQLSGGQQQRVAMGRAIIREPQAFLMDEPLSNLDAKLRVTMRTSLQQLHARLGTTTVYVTHDQVEAMTLGQRVAVMRDGKLQQVDAPQTLYDEPVNTFVAAFIGSPVDEPRRRRRSTTTRSRSATSGSRSTASRRPHRHGERRRHRRHPARRRSRTSRSRPAACRRSTCRSQVLEELGSDALHLLPRRGRAGRRSRTR